MRLKYSTFEYRFVLNGNIASVKYKLDIFRGCKLLQLFLIILKKQFLKNSSIFHIIVILTADNRQTSNHQLSKRT